MKDEIYDILSGKSEVRFGTIIQSISNYLGVCSKSSQISKTEKQFKKEETKSLENYISDFDLWIIDIDFTKYISEGAEQRVFLKNETQVIKLNDSIYYSCWEDYFRNLLLHNYFFPDTAYKLLGFTKEKEVLYAVVQQAFVSITEQTDLEKVKKFMESNGFENTRNHDYFNKELGIILEDLHDENVLTQNGILYFIDTVFFITNEFLKK